MIRIWGSSLERSAEEARVIANETAVYRKHGIGLVIEADCNDDVVQVTEIQESA